MCDFLGKGLPKSKTFLVCSELASSTLNGHLFWSRETDNRKLLYFVHRVVLVSFSEKNTPLAFPNNLPPLPHSHTKKWQREAAELFGRWQQGGVDGNVKALAEAHPLTSVAATAVAAVAAGGGQWRLLCSARVGVGPLTRWLALLARGPGWQGGGSGARFAWLALGSGR